VRGEEKWSTMKKKKFGIRDIIKYPNPNLPFPGMAKLMAKFPTHIVTSIPCQITIPPEGQKVNFAEHLQGAKARITWKTEPFKNDKTTYQKRDKDRLRP
jgi:hypothetical protein